MFRLCLWEWFCFREDFIHHSSTILLGGAELRTLTSILCHSALFQLPASLILWQSRAQYNIADNMGTIHLGTPHIVTLEERVVMAKSSMVASTIPKSRYEAF